MEIITAKQARQETENALKINEFIDYIMKNIENSSKEGKLSAIVRIQNIREKFEVKKIIQEKMKDYGFRIDSKVDGLDAVFAISW